MHWNVAPDALFGSARLVLVLDCWLNDCNRRGAAYLNNFQLTWLIIRYRDDARCLLFLLYSCFLALPSLHTSMQVQLLTYEHVQLRG